MKKDRCSSNNHKWVCCEKKGGLGEIISKTYISSGKLAYLSSPDEALNVCSRGEIVCDVCGASFIKNENSHSSSIEELLNKKILKS